jgi:acyl-CoA synthetase (AMP-forming)/AMP-acid ligase II/phosphosulfolactate synthase (CoM biosynthesis protein A)
MTVEHLIRIRAGVAGRPAFVHAATGEQLTWAGIAQLASTWADNRHALQGDSGRCVGLLIDDPLTMIGCYLAGLASGIAVAPLNPDATAAELAAQSRILRLATIVTDSFDGRAAASLADAGCDIWSARPGELERHLGRRGDPPPLPPRGASLVLASSGTTGDPKIIPLTEAQLLQAASAVAAHHEFNEDDWGYSPLPLFHINALVVAVLSTVVAGSTLVVDRRFSRRQFWSTVAQYDVTWLNLVPAIITAIATGDETPAGPTERIRFVRSASAALPVAALRRFEDRFGIPILETYGMTEAAGQIAANPLDAAQRRAGSVGLPVGIELRVVDTERRQVDQDVVGDIEIRGPSVIRSYWANAGVIPPTKPAASPDGWLGTGDVGHIDAGGFVYLAGRRDDVINRGGEKFYPREIEEALLGDDRVVGAVVVGRPHPSLGEEPVAYVLVASGVEGRAELLADLHTRCAVALSRYKRPAMITVAQTLPFGSTGKIRRVDVRARAAATGDADETTSFGLALPERSSKPRTSGLTMVIDNGLPVGYFADAIDSAARHIDMVKFGWGTAIVTDGLQQKIACLRDNHIRFCFGGTLFEKYVIQDGFDAFLRFCEQAGCDFVEVSNGTIPLSNTEKAAYIRKCADSFDVVSEVGVKDAQRSEDLDAQHWVDCIAEDLEAGATLVIAEARESGRSGICRPDGTLRLDLVEEILISGIDPRRLLFEAPTKDLQAQFVARLGPDVNLGNIAAGDVIGVETLRLGLRSDTLMHTERVALHG